MHEAEGDEPARAMVQIGVPESLEPADVKRKPWVQLTKEEWERDGQVVDAWEKPLCCEVQCRLSPVLSLGLLKHKVAILMGFVVSCLLVHNLKSSLHSFQMFISIENNFLWCPSPPTLSCPIFLKLKVPSQKCV